MSSIKISKQVPEDITRELGRGSLTIGYNGQTPERIKKHMENWHTFDIDDSAGQWRSM